MFNSFLDKNNKLLVNRLARAQAKILALSLSTKEEYLAQVTSLINREINTGYAMQNLTQIGKGWKKPSTEQNKACRTRYHDRDPDHYYRMRRCQTNEYRKTNPERYKVLDLRATLKDYGLSIEQFQEIEKKQDHVCAICHKPNEMNGKKVRLCVDHDHETGEVRGLLCNSCNVLLGMTKDNIETLLSSIQYLKNTAPVLQT